MSDNDKEPANKRVKKTHACLVKLPHLEPTNVQNCVASLTKSYDLQVGQLQLEDLPNEILLKVFDNLPINDLIKCGQVNKRIRQDDLLRAIDNCSIALCKAMLAKYGFHSIIFLGKNHV